MAFPASTTTVSDVLKQGYEGPIRNQINREALIYQLFSEGPHSWEGNTIIIPTHVGGVASTAITYSSESSGVSRAALTSIGAVASSQNYGKFIVDSSYLYAAFMVTGQAMAKAPQQSGENADAFIGAMWSEMNGLQKDIKNKLNTDMFTGHGVVAFLVDNAAGGAGVGAGQTTGRVVSGTNMITAGAAPALGGGDTFRIVHVPRDPAASWALLTDGAGGTSFCCTAKDEYNGTCTLNSLTIGDVLVGRGPVASGVGATEFCIMVKGNSPLVLAAVGIANPHTNLTISDPFLQAGLSAAAQATASRECVGLNALAFLPNAAGAFANDRLGTANTVLRGQGFKTEAITAAAAGSGGFSVGNQLDLEDVQLVMDGLSELVEGYPTDCMIMHRFTRAEFLRIIQASRDVMGLSAGPQNAPGYVYEPGTDLAHQPGELNYHGIPIKVSKDVPLGCIYLINRDSINTYTLKSGSFETFHGGEVITQVRNGGGDFVDAKEGFWKQYFQLVSECPRAIGVMAGIRYKKA